ncbi:MAG: hypothetical protein QOF51_870 [Chloroflexota bacterium]|jgi:hypothetical protein|nr:hypothetical protein [Chloroflexota bacterium]
MDELNPLAVPDPFVYRSIWGIAVESRRSFDLLVARQLLWLPAARPAVRQLLFTEDEQPICPACGELITTGTPAVVGMAVLADAELQARLARDPASIAARDPDGLEAWWLVHGTCLDALTPARLHELDRRIELALRASTRAN